MCALGQYKLSRRQTEIYLPFNYWQVHRLFSFYTITNYIEMKILLNAFLCSCIRIFLSYTLEV